MKNTDNISQLKEMIITKQIDIKSLDKVELEALIDHEYEMMDENRFDDQFLSLCLQELDRFTDPSFIEKIDADAIIDNAWHIYKKEAAEKTTQKPAFGFKRTVRILIAAAIITAIMTVSVVACWNPFISWLNERRITDIKQGEILQNESGDLTVDNQIQIFDTIKEMENALCIEFDTLDSITVSPQIIQLTQHQFGKEIKLSYTINQEPVVFRIFIENAPYYKEPLEKAGLDKQTVFNLEWYVIEDDCVTLVAFDNDYVYAISIDSLDTLAILTEGK